MMEGPATRMLNQRGSPLTIHSYALDYSNPDEQGDPEVTETTTQATGYVHVPNSIPRTFTRPNGTEMEMDARIFVLNESGVSGALDAHADSTQGVERLPEITRERDSVRYQVLSAFIERNGVVRCEAKHLGHGGA